MGFGFSSMPSAAQRAAQTQMRLPDTMAMAQAAGGGSGGLPASQPGQPPSAPSDPMNIRQAQQINPGQSFDPGGVNIQSPHGGIPTPTPWSPGGVNLPPQYQAAAQSAAPTAEAAGGSDIGSLLASIFGA